MAPDIIFTASRWFFTVPAAALQLGKEARRALPTDAPQHHVVERMRRLVSERYRYLAPGQEGAARNLREFASGAAGGHCEYFATMLALMLRSAGIPARLVTGYRSLEWNEEATELTIRERHAHAWVEVLDPEAGWYAVDGTPAIDGAEVRCCCYGCVLGQQITRARGEDGAAAAVFVRLGLGVFFAINVMMVGMPAYVPYVYGAEAGPVDGPLFQVLRVLALVLTAPVLLLLGGLPAGLHQLGEEDAAQPLRVLLEGEGARRAEDLQVLLEEDRFHVLVRPARGVGSAATCQQRERCDPEPLALSLLHPRSSLVRCGPDPEFCGARPVLSTRW